MPSTTTTTECACASHLKKRKPGMILSPLLTMSLAIVLVGQSLKRLGWGHPKKHVRTYKSDAGGNRHVHHPHVKEGHDSSQPCQSPAQAPQLRHFYFSVKRPTDYSSVQLTATTSAPSMKIASKHKLLQKIVRSAVMFQASLDLFLVGREANRVLPLSKRRLPIMTPYGFAARDPNML